MSNLDSPGGRRTPPLCLPVPPWTSLPLYVLALLLMLQCLPLAAANQAPVVSLHFAGNQSFAWPGRSITYKAIVSDTEDGDTLSGSISGKHVDIAYSYVPAGSEIGPFSSAGRAQGEQLERGKRLVQDGDCVLCHTVSSASLIPSYRNIALRYQAAPDIDGLAEKIIRGGQGTWGNMPMTPHPALAMEDARAMVAYIFSTANEPGAGIRWLPLSGTVQVPGSGTGTGIEQDRAGSYVFWVNYTDRGEGARNRKSAELLHVLRRPVFPAAEIQESKDLEQVTLASGEKALRMKAASAWLSPGAYDLGTVRSLLVELDRKAAPAGGLKLEVRSGRPGGNLLGSGSSTITKTKNGADRLRVALAATQGMHKVYVVLKHEDSATAGTVLLRNLRFEM